MSEAHFHPLDFLKRDEEDMRQRAKAYFDLMARRRTVREFSDRPVPRDVIETCLKTAGRAPSGANQQPWTFACIANPAMKREVRIAAEEEEKSFYAGRAGEEWLGALEHLGTDWEKPFLERAPWLIGIFGQRFGLDADGQRSKHYYVPESIGIATGFLISALHNAGLATLTHTPSPMGFLNKICKRPDHEKAYILLVVGYPEETCQVPVITKKPLDETTIWFD